jgi:hypothetical protein
VRRPEKRLDSCPFAYFELVVIITVDKAAYADPVATPDFTRR